jgi:hypothetical protein
MFTPYDMDVAERYGTFTGWMGDIFIEPVDGAFVLFRKTDGTPPVEVSRFLTVREAMLHANVLANIPTRVGIGRA